jgi:hypothetical protein
MEFVSGPQTAFQLPIEDWIESHFTLQYARNNNIIYDDIVSLKEKITRLFNAYGWYVIDPPGDGFCGIYVAKIAYEMSRSYRFDYISPIVCPTKEFFFDIIIMGIESYRATYKQLEIDLLKYINLSLREIQQYIIRVDAGGDKEEITLRMRNIPIAKMLIAMYRNMLRQRTIPLTGADDSSIDLNLDRDFTKEGQLNIDKATAFKQIELYGDVDIQILYFLAYAYQHNYIVLQFEKWSRLGDLNERCSYHRLNYNYYKIGWSRGKELAVSEHIIESNSQSIEEYKRNTSILFNDAHFVLIHNIDKTVTEALIEEFAQPNGEQLWRHILAFANIRAFFRVHEPLYNYIRGRGIRSKRLKRRQLKQHKYTLKYIQSKLLSKPRSKLLTLKLKKRNSKVKATQKQRTRKTH